MSCSLITGEDICNNNPFLDEFNHKGFLVSGYGKWGYDYDCLLQTSYEVAGQLNYDCFPSRLTDEVYYDSFLQSNYQIRLLPRSTYGR